MGVGPHRQCNRSCPTGVLFMKALVTGAAGFIGSTLSERLVRDGADVRLRPVLMTALVASLGFVPMALTLPWIGGKPDKFAAPGELAAPIHRISEGVEPAERRQQ